MSGRVSARAEVITHGRGRGRRKRRFGPKVSPSLCFAGYGVMRGLSPLPTAGCHNASGKACLSEANRAERHLSWSSLLARGKQR